MAIKIAIQQERDGFLVWCMLDDADFNGMPAERDESFVVGASAERLQDALSQAKRELEEALGQVEVLAHDAGARLDPSQPYPPAPPRPPLTTDGGE